MADLTINPLDVLGEARATSYYAYLSDVHGREIAGHTAGGVIVRSRRGSVPAAGVTLDLVPNADVVDPAASYYTIIVGRFSFLIEKSAGSQDLADAIVIDPADVDSALSLDDLADVDVDSPANGEGLIYNSTTGNWEPGATSATVNALDAVGDVNAPAPTDGQVLTWDSTPGEWVASDPTGGVGVTDGDKGDVVVASSGTVWTVPDLAGKQPLDSDLTAIAALTTTAYGRALLELADAAAGRTALGLGTAATQATSAFDAAGSAAAAQAAAIAASQPVDSDLTAIAALSTTSYGRSLLTLADAVALTGQVSAASDTSAGKVELATTTEATTGTDTARAVTPAGVKAATDALVAGGTALTGLAGPSTTLDSDDGVLAYEDGTPVIATPLYLSTVVDTAGAVMNADTSTAAMSFVVDEDNMASDSATKVPTQQSTKAYADTKVAASLFDANTILAANSDNTPAALTVAEQRVVGRLTGGNITALTPNQVLNNILDGATMDGDVTISNSAGRRLVFSNAVLINDIAFRLYLDSDDAEPALEIVSLIGAAAAIRLGPGGSTAPDTVLSRGGAGRVSMTAAQVNPGTAAIAGRVPARIATNVTAVGNVTTGEDNLQSFSVPASSMSADGQEVHARWKGTFANNGNAKTLRVKWAGTTVATATLPTSVAGSWRAHLEVCRDSTNAQCAATIYYNGAVVTGFATVATTFTNANTALATGDATSTNDIVSEVLQVDWFGESPQ